MKNHEQYRQINTLPEQVEFIVSNLDLPDATRERFEAKLIDGTLTRNEDPFVHIVVFFLPVRKEWGQVQALLVHHKGTGLWLAPGGHVEGELLEDAVMREAKEELNYEIDKSQISLPFLCYLTEDRNPAKPCKEHLDIWFTIEPDDQNLKIEERELGGAKWLEIGEAIKLVTDPSTRAALRALEKQL